MSVDTVRGGLFPADFLRGLRGSLPAVISATPFALLYGALAVENGLSVRDTVLMSATVFGGASQMVGIELFGQGLAPWLIVLSIFAVNFRHVLYSGAVGRHIGHWSPTRQGLGFFLLVDPQYAETEAKAARGEEITFGWYLGVGLPIYLFWVTGSWIGAQFSSLVPDASGLGIDFLLPIYFLGLVMEFRARPLWLPVVAVSAGASVAAFHLIGSPWHVSVGAAAGILLAALMPARAVAGGTA